MKKLKGYKTKHIMVAHLEDVLDFPPVINLIEVLLAHEHKVYFVGYNVKSLPDFLLNDSNFEYTELPLVTGSHLWDRLKRGVMRNRLGRTAVKKYMERADYLWTTTDLTCRCLGKLLFHYRHIMQLMELDIWYPYFKNIPWPRFPIAQYAQRAWKVVEPEINRAYIQKAIWHLSKTPYVFPNKNYMADMVEPNFEIAHILDRMRKEKRKIVFYMGVVMPERELEPFIEAIEQLKEEYVLYIAGYISDHHKKYYENIFSSHKATVYLGVFPAPAHLLLLEKAYIGLLPYKPGTDGTPYRSVVNALYCAPNKIFEYSGFGIPMISTDVLALRSPFEKFDIGICLNELSVNNIFDAIHKIECNHDKMSDNCKEYYKSVNLDEIIENILDE